ncbi:MAG: OmpH family outer membrane protein [Acidobacteria bacterium]|nr:OmpH family outer membrane protein [Acidobacteriota bacterium]
MARIMEAETGRARADEAMRGLGAELEALEARASEYSQTLDKLTQEQSDNAQRSQQLEQEIAQAEGYDSVFDKSGDFVFLYTREQFDLSNQVLEELGIEIDPTGRSGGR